MFTDMGTYIVYDDVRIFCKIRSCFLNFYMNSGYYECTIYVGSELKKMKVHRMMCLAFKENPSNHPCINHIDGDKLNNALDNLEWCTYLHNNQHAIDTGLRDVSTSNSERWLDEEWAKATRNKISQTRIDNGTAVGRNNPRFKYEVIVDGAAYTTKEFYENFVDVSECSRYTGLNARVKSYLEAGKHYEFFNKHNAVPRYAK